MATALRRPKSMQHLEAAVYKHVVKTRGKFITRIKNDTGSKRNSTTVFIPVCESAGSSWFPGLLFALIAWTDILPGLGAERKIAFLGQRTVNYASISQRMFDKLSV